MTMKTKTKIDEKTYKDERGEFIFRYKGGRIIKIYVDGFRRVPSNNGLKSKKRSSTFADIEGVSVETPEFNGFKAGDPMTFKEADEDKVNPDYNWYYENQENCQTCVVAFEMRMRGYNVEALGLVDSDFAISDEDWNRRLKQLEMCDDARTCWKDKDGNPPEEIYWDRIKDKESSREIEDRLGDPEKLFQIADENVKQGERYVFAFSWSDAGKSWAHIISMFRDDNGELVLYDPQKGGFHATSTADTKKFFLEHVEGAEKDYYGRYRRSIPQLVRVDNLDFDFENYGIVLGESRYDRGKKRG